MSKADTIKKPRTEKAARPAKQWRNKFKVLRGCKDRRGLSFKRGDFVTHLKLYPSKEIAEQKALDALRDEACGRCLKYRGAFPVTQS